MAWPSGKAEACKASIPQFESGCHLIYLRFSLLSLISTPIGNLSDITFRAIELLKDCDLILCEDTRHSKTLLDKYEIKKPLQSYHKFNQSQIDADILNKLHNGMHIGLICDAGTPCIADPGQYIVQSCIKKNIPIQSIPGPCAFITALICSGLETNFFQFLGFIPKKSSEMRHFFLDILQYKGTSIFYDTPHHIEKTLSLLHELAPNRYLVLAKELTKKFESFFRGTPENVLVQWQNSAQKGEIVLLLQGNIQEDEAGSWENISIHEHVKALAKTYNISLKDAIKMVAQIRGIPKKDLYKQFHT